jgi:hypothetical protein
VRKSTPEKVLKWLQSNPSLDALSAEFPELRESIRSELAEIVADGSTNGLPEYLKRMSHNERILERKFHGSRGDSKIASALVQQAVRNRMAHLSIKQHLVSEATGIEKGKVRFNRLNGYIAQKLLFSDGLERKQVSLFWFRLLWPLLPQRRLLMPLVQPEGIYCFYSRQLVDELFGLIASRNCLEIAAGDGTLTLFLADRGAKITATDDYSWKHEVHYPEFVIKRDAGDALREYAPEVVLCSWPPAGNSFEHQVFRTKSVQLYVVIGSRHRFAAGNWEEYRKQSAFDFEENEALSRLVLPPELDGAVYIFRRKLVADANSHL